MSFHWDIKTLPDLADLSPEQKKQIEGSSALLAVWDWRTLINLPILLVCFWVADTMGLDGNDPASLWFFVPLLLIFFVAFFGMLILRMQHHARRIAKSWRPVHESTLPDNADSQEPKGTTKPIATWRGLLSRGGVVIGLSLVVAGIYYHQLILVGVGIFLVYAAMAVITSYNVCYRCHQWQVHFGKPYNHCMKCSAAFPKDH